MKLLVISDLHGSYYYTKKIEEIELLEQPNKIIVLGDLYYHGPRNPLPEGYAPMKVCEFLNARKDKLICLKGNCDAEVDEMISSFKMYDKYIYELGNKKIYFTHGHKYNIDNLPKEDFDIMIYGHFHINFIEETSNKIFASPGSLSLPKESTKNSYMVIDSKKIIIKDLEGNILKEKEIF